jgi:hypothetical protein
MMKSMFGFSVVAALSIGIGGCGKSADQQPQGSTDSAVGGDAYVDHSDHAATGGSEESAMEKMNAALVKLSPEDAASAKSQHLCPVSDEMLGAMGAPLKVEVEGREVWICCEGCRDALTENPGKYLAKLNETP